jgi:hypothetical protein
MYERRIMMHLHPVVGGPLLARANSRIAARTFARMLPFSLLFSAGQARQIADQLCGH